MERTKAKFARLNATLPAIGKFLLNVSPGKASFRAKFY